MNIFKEGNLWQKKSYRLFFKRKIEAIMGKQAHKIGDEDSIVIFTLINEKGNYIIKLTHAHTQIRSEQKVAQGW